MRIFLDEAAILLGRGDVVGVPTETVYGLAASIHQPAAIARIFSLKGRPADNPLIVHIAHSDDVMTYAHCLPSGFQKLAAAFWPGPLTLIAPAKQEAVPSIARASLSTAAFRVPSHPVVHQLLLRTGPLVMPSANISGSPSSTCAAHVEADFGHDFPVLEGGYCPNGMESTILYFHEGRWVVIRLGALPAESFEVILGYCPAVFTKKQGESPLCPGQLYRHYAPHARLTFGGEMPSGQDFAIIGFEDRIYPAGIRLFSLGSSSDAGQACRSLYAILRSLDEYAILHAWVDTDFPDTGLWTTLKERLAKAASPPQNVA